MFNFKKHIEGQGVAVEFSFEFNIDYTHFDIIHTFGVNFIWSYLCYKNAKLYNKPLIVSPIFFSGVGNKNNVIEILDYASGIIVFSEKEIEAINEWTEKDYSDKCHIIVNGVDEIFFSDNNERTIDVLQVGSFHPRKQQHVVCQACNELGIVPTFAGTKHDFEYYNKCERYNINYIGKLDHDALAVKYSEAKIVIQPSLVDPFPNTLLEAGAAGCQFILTKNTYVPDDFPHIRWCDAGNTEQIKRVIGELLGRGRNKKLSKYIRRTFNWDEQARKTIKLYEQCISS